MFENKKDSNVERRTVASLIEDFFNNGVNRVLNDDLWNEKSASVPVNIKETPTAYDMQLIAPGLMKEDFKLHLDKNILTVSFDHKDEVKDGLEEGRWLRHEYLQRSFKRSFTINEKIDTSGIQARYADGILHINLPKKDAETAPPQKITVG
jgi:HSP20 family protein